MGKMDEQIIVVPRPMLFAKEKLTFQGTETDPHVVNQLLANIQSYYEIMRRGDAEEDTDFKQPIPYAVIRRGDELFTYERLQGGGEARLHGNLSLGAGGHMNPVEGEDDFMKVVDDNLTRELDEELEFSSDEKDIKVVGFINDDENEVGRVHIAVLVVIDVSETTEVTVKETDQLEGEFVYINTLKSKPVYDRLENWSKIVVDTLTK